LFEPGAEVVGYRTADECVKAIDHLLSHEPERSRIAQAGHARTLREHTYAGRMAELVALVQRLL
jgi:spore maturation protein CgeB